MQGVERGRGAETWDSVSLPLCARSPVVWAGGGTACVQRGRLDSGSLPPRTCVCQVASQRRPGLGRSGVGVMMRRPQDCRAR